MSDLDAVAGQPFTATLDPYATGRAAYLAVIVVDADDAPVTAEIGAITETEAERYDVQLTVAEAAHGLRVQWSDDLELLAEDTLSVVTLTGVSPPSIDDLAALVFADVTGEFGAAETFTASSRPTAEQAAATLEHAVSMIAAQLGPDPPARFHDAARYVMLLYAALILEPGYHPERLGNYQASWDAWKALYDDAMPALLRGIAGETDTATDGVVGLKPVWSFGACAASRVAGSEAARTDSHCRVW